MYHVSLPLLALHNASVSNSYRWFVQRNEDSSRHGRSSTNVDQENKVVLRKTSYARMMSTARRCGIQKISLLHWWPFLFLNIPDPVAGISSGSSFSACLFLRVLDLFMAVSDFSLSVLDPVGLIVFHSLYPLLLLPNFCLANSLSGCATYSAP